MVVWTSGDDKLKDKVIIKIAGMILLLLLIGASIMSICSSRADNCNAQPDVEEQPIDGLYFMRDLGGTLGNWEGSLKRSPPSENGCIRCGLDVAFLYNETQYEGPFSISNIYYRFWCHRPAIGWEPQHYIAGYNTTNKHHGIGFDFDDRENGTIDIYSSDFITEVDDHRLLFGMQYTDPEVVTVDYASNLTIILWGCGGEPNITDRPHQYSYLLINVPDNDTLRQQDTDGDALNDYYELYVSFTNPIDYDTDGDGVSDYDEVVCGSDPNNYLIAFTIEDIPLIYFPMEDEKRDLVVYLGEGIGGPGDEQLDIWAHDDITPQHELEAILYVKGESEEEWTLIKPMNYIRQLFRGNITAAEIEEFYNAGHAALQYKVTVRDEEDHISERPAPLEETVYTITILNDTFNLF